MATTEVRSDEQTGSFTATQDPEPPGRALVARNADRLATLGVLAVSVGTAAWFTRDLYFFQDDFIFLRQAQRSSLSLGYVRLDLLQHFSPISRLFDMALARWFGDSLAAARAIELTLLAAAVLAFAWAITEMVGRRWWRHLLTLAFGQSLALVHLLVWWTAAANILPATLLGLLTIAAFLRYRRLHERRWVVLSLACYALSLFTHETSWLVPGYLILFDLLVFAPERRVRPTLVWFGRHGWIWLSYGVLTALAMVNYFAFYYAALRPKPTLSQIASYIGVQFTQTFAPTAVGLRPLTTSWTNSAALVVDALVLVVAVTVSIYRRPAAWRVWAVFVIGFLANSIMIGANRVGRNGVDAVGKELFYVQAPAYLFLLCVGAAFSLDRGGLPYVVRQGAVERPRLPMHARNHAARSKRIWWATVCVVAVGLYEVAFLNSATTMAAKDSSSQESQVSRTYFTEVLGKIDKASQVGRRVAILHDTPVSPSIIAPAFAPYNQLSFALSVLNSKVFFNQLGDESFDVGQNGTLNPVKFERLSGTPRGLPIAGFTTGPEVRQSQGSAKIAEAGGRCFAVGHSGVTVDVRLASIVSTPDAAWLVVGLTSSSNGAVDVSTLSNGVQTGAGAINMTAGAASGDYLLPLSQRRLDGLQIIDGTAGQSLCITSVDVGSFSASS